LKEQTEDLKLEEFEGIKSFERKSVLKRGNLRERTIREESGISFFS